MGENGVPPLRRRVAQIPTSNAEILDGPSDGAKFRPPEYMYFILHARGHPPPAPKKSIIGSVFSCVERFRF